MEERNVATSTLLGPVFSTSVNRILFYFISFFFTVDKVPVLALTETALNQ